MRIGSKNVLVLECVDVSVCAHRAEERRREASSRAPVGFALSMSHTSRNNFWIVFLRIGGRTYLGRAAVGARPDGRAHEGGASGGEGRH